MTQKLCTVLRCCANYPKYLKVLLIDILCHNNQVYNNLSITEHNTKLLTLHGRLKQVAVGVANLQFSYDFRIFLATFCQEHRSSDSLNNRKMRTHSTLQIYNDVEIYCLALGGESVNFEAVTVGELKGFCKALREACIAGRCEM